MSTPPEQFARIASKVDLDTLSDRLVVIVGVGSLGSQIARELAHSGVGSLWLVDGDEFKEVNVIRHALPRQYVAKNKAEALTLYLSGEVPTLNARAVARDLTENVTDSELDKLFRGADLIVAATDDRRAQRRVNASARRLDIRTISPGLYEDDGGEVFVQQDADLPCFSCWDEFRPADATLRAAVALNVDTLPILFLTVELCLGTLDRGSVYFRRLVGRQGAQVPILYRLAVRDEIALGVPEFLPRPDCPVCGESRRPPIPPNLPQSRQPPVLWSTALPPLVPLDVSSPAAVRDLGDSVILSFGLVLAAVAFALCPHFIMTVLLPGIGVIRHQEPVSIWATLLLLVVGPGCFIWAIVGIAAIVAAFFQFLIAVVFGPSRVRPVGALLVTGLMAFVFDMFLQGKAWPIAAGFFHLILP